jgi:hypothetical protein
VPDHGRPFETSVARDLWESMTVGTLRLNPP